MSAEARRRRGWFPAFLGFVIALFIGLLVYVYFGATRANPVILDEKGRPRGAASP
jgi:hypothetical protein